MAVTGRIGREGSKPLLEPELEDLLEGADEVLGGARRHESGRRATTDPVHRGSPRVAHDQGHPPAEEHHRPPRRLISLAGEGKLGRKSGSGFYDYG